MISLWKSVFGVREVNAFWTQPTIGVNATTGQMEVTGSLINLPAVLIVALITLVLTRGIRESARMNFAAVVIKLIVIAMFIFTCIKFVDGQNLTPFVPENTGKFGSFGASGILQGMSLLVLPSTSRT